MNEQIRTQAYAPSVLRANHDRAQKAADNLNASLNYKGVRQVTADCQPGKLAVLVVAYRSHSSKPDAPYKEALRYQTREGQKIGKPVTYRNQYSSTNMGTMCWGVDEAEKRRQRELAGLRSIEKRLADAHGEVARLEKLLADRKAELNL
jgi:hypothetical protein